MYFANPIPSIPIIIASQHVVFSQNLAIRLSRQKAFKIVGILQPVNLSKRFLRTGQPAAEPESVLVLDIAALLPQAVQLLADWHGKQLRSKILIVGDALTEGFMLKALCYGVRGFMAKTCPLETYVKAIQVIYTGDFWISRKMLVQWLKTVCRAETSPVSEAFEQSRATANSQANGNRFAQPVPAYNEQPANPVSSSCIFQGQETLTDREQEIVNYVSQGLSNKEIAKAIGVSDKTVKTHLHAVFSKLKIRHRMDLVLLKHQFHRV
jgi:DNA-binding NarL/FixJ family response regulator